MSQTTISEQQSPVFAAFLIFGSAAAIGFAWWFPGTWISFFLTWLAAFMFILLAQSPRSLRKLYISGCLVQIIGFYWLFETIHRFGEFSVLSAGLIFSLFVVASALQFLLFALLYRYLPKSIDIVGLRAPLAWVTVELCAIRIFPWHLGHTVIAFPEFVQFADVVGSLGISFLIMWLAESCILSRKHRVGPLLSFGTLILCLWYGKVQVFAYSGEQLARSADEPLNVVLIQGDIPLYRESEASSPDRDIEVHKKLSLPYDRANEVIIWPETAIMHWVYAGLKNNKQDPRLPRFRQASLLSGSLMFLDRETVFNSAFVIQPDGTIGKPYHKRVLMPYGEYTPFSETFPWLLEVNNTAGNFTAGETPAVHSVVVLGRTAPVRMATLICYEDVVQSLSTEAVRAGAEVLVNLTNDAWFGDSPALHQHHLIASFRAIENKRFHLRATNTGKTAIVSPVGETIASLPTHQPGALSVSVTPLHEMTLFSHIGNWPWRILSVLTLLLCCMGALRRRKQ